MAGGDEGPFSSPVSEAREQAPWGRAQRLVLFLETEGGFELRKWQRDEVPSSGGGAGPSTLAVPEKNGQDRDKDRGGLEPGWGGCPGPEEGGTGPHLSEDDAGPEELGENGHRP